MTKAEDIRAKSEDELNKELLELKKEQFNLRFQHAQGQLANTSQVRTVRRKIARIKTILVEKLKGADTKKTAAPKASKKTTTKKKEKAA